MKKKNIKLILLISILTLIICAIMYCYFENTNIKITEINIINSKIPAEFDGYKIAHISDLHNTEFGNNNKTLLKKIKLNSPDVIFITGDIFDESKANINIGISFIEEAIKIAPTYYVTGNHESYTNEYPALANKIKNYGINILDNQCVELDRNGSKINLVGLADPDFSKVLGLDSAAIFSNYLEEMDINSNNYTILLSHRPEMFDFYVQNKFDLVFSGHAHGGQFRLPFVGGVIAPNQGIFPEYTSGIYENGNTKMIVNRGLGNSIIPIRINNNPEIIIVTMKAQSHK